MVLRRFLRILPISTNFQVDIFIVAWLLIVVVVVDLVVVVEIELNKRSTLKESLDITSPKFSLNNKRYKCPRPRGPRKQLIMLAVYQ